MEYRVIVIHDDQPNPDTMADLEASLNAASQDGVSTTFVSIDGVDYEGKFHAMLGALLIPFLFICYFHMSSMY